MSIYLKILHLTLLQLNHKMDLTLCSLIYELQMCKTFPLGSFFKAVLIIIDRYQAKSRLFRLTLKNATVS